MFDLNKFQNNNRQSTNTNSEFIPLTDRYNHYIQENVIANPLPNFTTATIYAISSKNIINNLKANQ